MTLPSGGNFQPISLGDLNTEFGYGTNLKAYRGKLVGIGSACKVISSGTVNLSDFYSTNKVGSGSLPIGTGTFTVPQYRTMTFTVTGGNGGQNGASGGYYKNGVLQSATAGSAGGAGVGSFFNNIISASGGAASGGAGGTNSVTLTNPLLGGTGPASGAAQSCSVGGGGAGGQGGPIFVFNNVSNQYDAAGYAASGASGAAGSASISWTGVP